MAKTIIVIDSDRLESFDSHVRTLVHSYADLVLATPKTDLPHLAALSKDRLRLLKCREPHHYSSIALLTYGEAIELIREAINRE